MSNVVVMKWEREVRWCASGVEGGRWCQGKGWGGGNAGVGASAGNGSGQILGRKKGKGGMLVIRVE